MTYASQSLSEAIQNHKITNFKGLAVPWSISRVETYNHGMNFAVITDHSASKASRDKSLLTGQLLRRGEKYSRYNFDIICRASKEQVVPDFIPRIYLTEMSVTD